MARSMWPLDALWKFNVRATDRQAGRWEYAAGIKGLKVPVFLALAADDFSRRLERRIARQERKERKG